MVVQICSYCSAAAAAPSLVPSPSPCKSSAAPLPAAGRSPAERAPSTLPHSLAALGISPHQAAPAGGCGRVLVLLGMTFPSCCLGL